MRQLVGVADGADDMPLTARELLVSLAPPALRASAQRLASAERTAEDDPMGYAAALADWGDHGGYDAEVRWDECLTRAVGIGLREATTRPLRTFSGGEQKRIVLEVLLRGEDDILLLDEPDNFLDVPAKRWLERELSADAPDRAVRQPRSRAARGNGHQGHHGGSRGSVDPRRRIRRLRRGSSRPPRQARRAIARGTTANVNASSTSLPRCAGGPRSPRCSHPS